MNRTRFSDFVSVVHVGDKPKLKPEDAYDYATQWGSLIRSGDQGACMYGFSSDCRPLSERHRADVLAWMALCRLNVLDRPKDFEPNELQQLDDFVEFIRDRAVKA